MNKKILVFNGSPKKEKSDTLHITNAFLEGMKSVNNYDISIVDVIDKNINYCKWCFSCKKNGGTITFQGSYEELLLSNTKTGNALKNNIQVKDNSRIPNGFLPIRNANVHNLKNIDVDIPLGVLTVVTGVAGSGKSSLIRDVFAKQYEDKVILIDQSSITATNRSTVCTFLGFFDEIRKVFAKENNVSDSLFTFNGKGACPSCNGKGYITTELIFMEPITTLCEECNGDRYSKEALQYSYKNKNIVEVLNMSVEDACEFFKDNKKIMDYLNSLMEVGLLYISLGQPLSTFSGGERQRVKLAQYIKKKGNIYVLDEPTTGLHASDIGKIMEILESIVEKGNTVIVIEHNTDVMKLADYIIDVGPDGGTKGGEIVFAGTPKEMIEHGDTITAEYLKKWL